MGLFGRGSHGNVFACIQKRLGEGTRKTHIVATAHFHRRARRSAKRTREDDEQPTDQAAAAPRRRATRTGGVSNEVINTLAAAGVRTVPDGHEEAMAAAANAASGSEVILGRIWGCAAAAVGWFRSCAVLVLEVNWYHPDMAMGSGL